MFSPEKIVVGIEMPASRPWDAANLGAPVRLAVRQAFDIAAAMSADVSMVCVQPDISTGFFGSQQKAQSVADADQAEAQAVLDDLTTQYQKRSQGTVKADSVVAFGRPWLEILKVAGPSQRNLIICGIRDQGKVSRMLFGSTGQKLLRNAVCPVWLVKPRIDDDADLDVLAATDLGDVGEDILFAGVALGQSLPVRLNILHVLDDRLEQHLSEAGASAEDLSTYREKTKIDAEDKLHHQLSLTDYRTVEKGVQIHFANGSPEDCILSAIENLDIDLLIMATVGRGGLPGMLLGNTAERLLPEIPCSILAIKPDDFQCPVPLGSDN